MVNRYDPIQRGSMGDISMGEMEIDDKLGDYVQYEDYLQEKQYRVSAEQYSKELFAENQAQLDDIEALEKERSSVQSKYENALATLAAMEKERDALEHRNEVLSELLNVERQNSSKALGMLDAAEGSYQDILRQNSALTGARDGAICEVERLKGERDELKSLLSDSSQIMEQQADLIDRQEKTSDDLLNSATQATEIAARAVEQMGEGWKTNSYEAQFMRHWCKDEAAKIRNGDIEL